MPMETMIPNRVKDLVLTDPTYQPNEHPGLFIRLAVPLVNDPRDLPFIRLMALLTITVIPIAVSLYIPGILTWWLASIYLALVLGVFLGPFILMLHNTSHRRLFRPRYAWMRHYIPWVLGPLFGETPDTYYAHHIGMHHPENNLDDDLSCTMRYQRDSLGDFGRYLFRFMIRVVPDLAVYLRRHDRAVLRRRMLAGEISYYTTVAALLFVDWRATLIVFVIPLLFTRFAMMSGNWAQHAFIDPADPANCYRNSITCINSSYNRRCFNDGYHIGHHLKANRHWTEMPNDFLANRDRYADEGAIVFEKIDYFVIWFLLMIRRYDLLANHYVDLSGENPSREEIIDLLKSRTRRIEQIP
ncbi:MAG: fatty acid desaturase [Candidatus Kapaibacterium sp.]